MTKRDPFAVFDQLTGQLRAALEASVPFRIADLRQRGGPLDRDWEEARAFGDQLAEQGDVVQFGGRKGEAATLFNTLAQTLAVMAFAPGGVTVFGLHWDADAAPLPVVF